MKKNEITTNHSEMNLATYDLDNFTYFELSFVDDNYLSTIKELFYQKEGDRYYKKYPQNLKNIESLKRNFHKYAVDMIKQFGYFNTIPIEQTLLEVINRLEKNSISYSIIGGASLLVRGIPVNTHDIDLMLESKDIDLMNEIFDDCLIEPILDTEGWVVKYFGVAFLNTRIDLSFEPQELADNPDPTDFGPYAMSNLEVVKWNGHKISVPPIELYLDVCKKRGKTKRVDLIKEYLTKKG